MTRFNWKRKSIILAIVIVACVVIAAYWPKLSRSSHWVWAYIPQPTREHDGFVYLDRAARAYEREQAITHEVQLNLGLASHAANWSGTPDMRGVPFFFSKHRFSDNLNGKSGYVSYKILREMVKSYSDHVTNRCDSDIDPDEAIALVLLGYQISRNREDNVVGLIRVGLWQNGFSALYRLGRIHANEYAGIQSRLQQEAKEIMQRDPNSLYKIK